MAVIFFCLFILCLSVLYTHTHTHTHTQIYIYIYFFFPDSLKVSVTTVRYNECWDFLRNTVVSTINSVCVCVAVTMALGLTQPLTEMSTRNISWGVNAVGWQPYQLRVPTVLKSGSHKLLEPFGPVQACNGIALPFTFMCSRRCFWCVVNFWD